MIQHKLILAILHFFCLSLFAQTEKGVLHLFHEEMVRTYPIDVYNFLERYLYDISHSTQGYDLHLRMGDDKVVVTKGSLDNISKLTPEMPFSIVRYDNLGYEVCWTDTLGHPLLGLQFPIQYELLLGLSRIDLENTLYDQLKACSDSIMVQPPDSTLEILEDGYYRSIPIMNYYVESLNTSTYYKKNKTNATVVPIYSTEKKWYSAANLFLNRIKDIAKYRIYIEQKLYGFNKKSYTISLAQWLNYCSKNNLTVYFAIEEEREDSLKALLIAQSHDLGFNHMMSIIIPDNFVEKHNTVFKAKLNAYIPTNNVKNLYQQYTERKKKKL